MRMHKFLKEGFMKDEKQDEALIMLRQQINESMKPLICKNTELNWPRSRKSLNFYMLKILGKILRVMP